MKSQPVQFPHSHLQCVVRGKSRAIFSATSPALIFLSQFRLSKGVGEITSDNSLARHPSSDLLVATQLSVPLFSETYPHHCHAELRYPGTPGDSVQFCGYWSVLSELLYIRGARVSKTHVRSAQHMKFPRFHDQDKGIFYNFIQK